MSIAVNHRCEGFEPTGLRCPADGIYTLDQAGFTTSIVRGEHLQHFCVQHATMDQGLHTDGCMCGHVFDEKTACWWRVYAHRQCPHHGAETKSLVR